MQDKNSTLNLIKGVKNHCKLYTNLTHNDEDDIKEWAAVAQECGMSVTEAQSRWNTLMNEYVEYLKNNQDFSLAQHMDFLQPHFFEISDKENIDEMELLNAIGSKNYEETNLVYQEHTENEKAKLKIVFEREKDVQKTKTHKPTLSSNTETKIDCKSSALPQDNSFTNMSSLELIFLGYAKQLQKMPLALQLSTKRKIADIMDEAELQIMNS